MAPRGTKRARQASEPESIAEFLRPFVRTRKWFSYAESPNSPVNRMVITANRRFVRDIHKFLDGNLSITPSLLDNAFKIIAPTLPDLQEHHRDDWSRTMSKRVRAMLRQFAQALVKRNAWAVHLVEAESDTEAPAATTAMKKPAACEKNIMEVGPHEEAEEEAKEFDPEEEEPKEVGDKEEKVEMATDADEWETGYSWEHAEAWRHPKGADGRRKIKESTKHIFLAATADPPVMRAAWPDGYECDLPELSEEQWATATHQRKHRGTKLRKAVFQGTRVFADTIVSVSYRPERPGAEIYRVLEGTKTITSVLLSRFGGDREQAKNLAIRLGQEYALENIDKKELIKRRDRLLPPKTRTTKKPSAATVDRPELAMDSGHESEDKQDELEEAMEERADEQADRHNEREDIDRMTHHDMRRAPSLALDLSGSETD